VWDAAKFSDAQARAVVEVVDGENAVVGHDA
jgi:hypothetical protein